MELRPYQQDAVNEVLNFLSTRKKSDPLVVAPTGSGKSILIGELCRFAVQSWPNTRILMLAHRKELLAQNAQKVLELWPNAPLGIYSAGLNSRQLGRNITIAGIASIYDKAKSVGWIDLCIIDEAHLIGNDQDSMYRTLIAGLHEINPKMRIIGFTATPYRLKSGMLTDPGGIFTDIAYEIEVGFLVREGFLSPLVSKSAETQADLSRVGRRGGEFIAGEAEAVLDKEELTRAAIDEMEKYCGDRKSWIIFAQGVEHAKHVAEALNARGHPAEVVVGETEDMFRASTLSRFKRRELKCLVNCDVLTTGFDAPCIDALILLRATTSTGLYVQMCLDTQTEILTTEGWKGHADISTKDLAATFNVTNSEIKFEKIEKIVAREMTQGESFIFVDSPHLDIRVSNYHDLIIRSRRGRGWQKETAEKSMTRKDHCEIPVCGEYAAPGSNLTEAELSFLGWFLSDGSWNKKTNAICISQSANSPYHDTLKKIFKDCNFRYGTQVVKRTGQWSKYASDIRYYISHGDARILNSTGGRGWGRLVDWISPSKILGKEYDTLTRGELLILLSSLNHGDGRKRKKFGAKKPWIDRTMAITCGLNKKMADRLQALCVTRGIRCNLKLAGTNNWMLYICSTRKSALIRGARIDDANKNAKLLREVPASTEKIWCVSTKTGTIVTRRNGKVAIMGNCGRGMRLYPGKENCVVLDFAGNIERHGPIDNIKLQRKSGSGGGKEVSTAPTKVCEKCRTAVPISQKLCPSCGFEFRFVGGVHAATASDAAIMEANLKKAQDALTPKRYEVRSVSYSRNQGREGKPDSLRVTYECAGGDGNLQGFKVAEWIHIENRKLRDRTCRWWLQMHRRQSDQEEVDIPIFVEAALDQANNLRKPRAIWVQKDGQFDRVVSHELLSEEEEQAAQDSKSEAEKELEEERMKWGL